ncbi:hypothetical protein K9U40_13745 [Xanthobacter autotrophicus]|uniref:hypothetical protein n=1 Tax=Xanthobacter TaxID=279 RepID=UPI0024AB4163|nr:hypothetical protein [Xanthobacter autotrophicus]MDI4665383.1 hypothetical protein [Xanthobacter autotrophicus]
MRQLSSLDYEPLCINDVARIVAYLEDALFFIANRDRTWVSDGSLWFLNEKQHRNELAILNILSSRLQYSRRFISKMDSITRDFGRKLERDESVREVVLSWKDLSELSRIELIIRQIDRQINDFARNLEIELVPPGLYIDDSEMEIGKSYEPDLYDGPNKAHIRLTTAFFRKDNPRKAMSFVYHEVLHSITWQFAYLESCGKIRDTNLLIRNAQLRRTLLEHNVQFPLQIYSHYKKSADEKLARRQQAIFYHIYFDKDA